MKIKSYILTTVLSVVLGQVVLSACSEGSGPSKDASSTGAETKGVDYVTVNGLEPQRPLIPGDTNENGGHRIIISLFSGLAYYDEDGKTQMDLAQSIESKDQKHFVVTLRDGIKFSDGSPIKAENFVRAWNYTVANDLLLSGYLEFIEGYDAVRDKKATELSGLKVVDDKTFTIDLTVPDSSFIAQLGFESFFPLPDVAFNDMEAFGQNPIGSGAYKMAFADAWAHNQSVSIVPNEYYDGPKKAQNDGIKFIFYPTLTAAYADAVSGQLDVLDKVPNEQLKSYKQDFGDRAISVPVARIDSLDINVNVPHFGMDEEGRLRRSALSQAIDRDQINQNIYDGTRKPAKEFASPGVDGYTANLPGNDVLSFNPEIAKELWEKAETIRPYKGQMSITYDQDGGHQAWVEAVANQWKNILGVEVQTDAMSDFKSLLQLRRGKKIPFASRGGWGADYPSAYNFLAPLYSSEALSGANDTQYVNSKFDGLLKSAASSVNHEEWQEKINEAQEILLKDLPAIPLWSYQNQVVHSDKVSDVTVQYDGMIIYEKIKKISR